MISYRLAFTVALLAAGACDTTVVNPGPAQDPFLDDPNAHPSVVAGAEAALARGLNHVAFNVMIVAREAVVSGNIHGQIRVGVLLPEEQNTTWQEAHKARWMAEDAVRRFRENLGEAFSSNPNVARALLQVGYANRILGENMCHAVIDGGDVSPYTAHLERAENAFSEAIAVAAPAQLPNVRFAALAGRAAVHVHRGDWTAAASDASQVLAEAPANFVHQQRFFDGEWDDYNRIHWYNANLPWRSFSIWSTFFEGYYLETADPRVPWGTDPEYPEGDALNVPWYFQRKFPGKESPMNLSSAREMRLILAEAALVGGAWQSAMEHINRLRTDVGVEPWMASDLEEAWTALKQERRIELWLEGRRLGDLRRWSEAGTPGESEDMDSRSLCFPISEDEQDLNPNVNG